MYNFHGQYILFPFIIYDKRHPFPLTTLHNNLVFILHSDCYSICGILINLLQSLIFPAFLKHGKWVLKLANIKNIIN